MRFLRRIARRKWRKNKISDKNSGSTSFNSSYEEPPATDASESALASKENGTTKLPDESASDPDNNAQVSIAQVPSLVNELHATVEETQTTESEKAARILRSLFALSDSEDDKGRSEMIADGTLIPVIFDFIERCRKEREQRRFASDHQALKQQPQLYLALLIVNNVSIPAANKRTIALEGTPVVSRLLVDDPSCHLAAILLVNWTVQDAALRREMVTSFPTLIWSVAAAVSAAILPPDVYRQQYAMASPAERVAALSYVPTAFDLQKVIFPDTIRWCLTVFQNLTRPTKDPNFLATRQLIETGIIPSILQCLETVSASASLSRNEPTSDIAGNSHPSTWAAQTVQDAALYIVLNLTADPLGRKSMASATNLLQRIIPACYSGTQSEVANLQCLKARMALSNIGSLLGGSSPSRSQPDNHSDLRVRRGDAEIWIELLANVWYRRSKEGPGGYAATTFSLKQVLSTLFALLRGHPDNQSKMVDVRLNTLLLKVVGGFAVQRVAYIDVLMAEHACISLYLLSHYGFQARKMDNETCILLDTL